MRSSSTLDTKREKREPDLSLDEMFAIDAERLERYLVDNIRVDPEVARRSLSEVERLKLTHDSVHGIITARDATVRQKFFSEYGLSQETIESAPEGLRSELLSRLYDSMHSPDAKFQSGLYWAAVLRDKRLEVKAKAEEILAVQRRRASKISIPKKLVEAVRQRSTHLYAKELWDHFKAKYVEEIEKSDAYIPSMKAALKTQGDVRLPNMYAVGKLMSNELLHPDAFGQILGERHAGRQTAMSLLSDWKWKRKHKRSIADARKHQEQQERRELILEWYKLLKPFHTRSRRFGDGKHAQLMALADDLSRNAIEHIVYGFIFLGGVWTLVLAFLFFVGDRDGRQAVLWFALPGFIGAVIAAFWMMRKEMRSRLENLAEGWWVAHDPITGKPVYDLMTCPECRKRNYTDHYLRYLEPCEYCGHNIDWEAAKRPAPKSGHQKS